MPFEGLDDEKLFGGNSAICEQIRTKFDTDTETEVLDQVLQAKLESAQAGARAGQQTVSVSDTSGNSALPSTAAVRTDHSSTYLSKDGSSGMTEEAASDWATLSSTPRVQSGRFAVLSSATDDECQQNSFTTVVSRRTRSNKRRRSHQSHPGVQPGVQSTSAQASQQRRRAPVLHGRAANGSVISAAEITRKKFVYCVDNVNMSGSVEKMKEFISRLSVNAVSCFEVKTRRRFNEDERNLNRRAVRVCILEDDCNRFLNPVRISEWFTKRNSRMPESNDKRLRVGSSGYAPSVAMATQQPPSAQPSVAQICLVSNRDNICGQQPAGDNECNDDTIILTSDARSMEYCDTSATDAIDATE